MSHAKLLDHVSIRFMVGALDENDVLSLTSGQHVICKLILTPDDYRLFNYHEGDNIEVETEYGNRQWCTIRELEIIEADLAVIAIFSLVGSSRHGSLPK